METVKLDVKGMTCSHCVATVTKAIRATQGVAEASVELDSGRAVVHGNKIDRQSLLAAVNAAGYEASLQ